MPIEVWGSSYFWSIIGKICRGNPFIISIQKTSIQGYIKNSTNVRKKSMKRQTKITKIFYLYTHAEMRVLLSGNIFKRVNDIINMLCF
jgi:hypothetical protein